jgi:AcrR family transcriptional regulator
MEKVTREKRIKKAISERIEKEKLELKTLITNTSAELFLESGYDKFSLRKVAERIGYSPTTIYLYFKDKDDLLFSVLLDGFKIFHQMMSDGANSTDNILDKINETGKAYINFGLTHPVYYRVMFMERCDLLLKDMEDKYQDTPISNSFGLLESLIKEGINKGILKSDLEANQLATLLWSLVHGIVSLHIMMPDFYTKEIVDINMNKSLKMLTDSIRNNV